LVGQIRYPFLCFFNIFLAYINTDEAPASLYGSYRRGANAAERIKDGLILEGIKLDASLTLSTTEVGRFLHTVPSTLGGTSVSAFTPSRLMDYLQGLCHQPVNGLHKRHYLLSKPYIHVYVPSARTTPHLSRPGALFRLSDIQATSKELMED